MQVMSIWEVFGFSRSLTLGSWLPNRRKLLLSACVSPILRCYFELFFQIAGLNAPTTRQILLNLPFQASLLWVGITESGKKAGFALFSEQPGCLCAQFTAELLPCGECLPEFCAHLNRHTPEQIRLTPIRPGNKSVR